MSQYIPEKGDFVVLTFDPQARHEQHGHRPALVVSHTLFNRHTGLAMVCPITNTQRNIPFHVPVSDAASRTRYIMVEQIKAVDYVSRRVRFIEKAHQSVLDEVLSVLDACLYEPV